MQRGQIIRDNRLICIQMELLANQSMSPATLTAVQAHILQYILRHREHGTSLTAIHRDFGYSMATLSGMLKRLREKGYIRTETCAVDDRCKLLYPTEKGEQVQEFLDGTIQAVEGEIYAAFPRRNWPRWTVCKRKCCITWQASFNNDKRRQSKHEDDLTPAGAL